MEEITSHIPAILILIAIFCYIAYKTHKKKYLPYEYEEDGDYVVLIHGIARTYKSMDYIAQFLNKKGYHTINVDYESTRYTVEDLVNNYLVDVIDEYCVDENKKIHFVTYSMGGILLRYYLVHYGCLRLGRVVMIAPPNYGSAIADKMKESKLLGFLYKVIYGPAGQQLGTTNDSIQAYLPDADFEPGIISGTSPLLPFLSNKTLEGDNDGSVSVESTKIKGYKDHCCVAASHLLIIYYRLTLDQILIFLRKGCFINNNKTS